MRTRCWLKRLGVNGAGCPAGWSKRLWDGSRIQPSAGPPGTSRITWPKEIAYFGIAACSSVNTSLSITRRVQLVSLTDTFAELQVFFSFVAVFSFSVCLTCNSVNLLLSSINLQFGRENYSLWFFSKKPFKLLCSYKRHSLPASCVSNCYF